MNKPPDMVIMEIDKYRSGRGERGGGETKGGGGVKVVRSNVFRRSELRKCF